MSPLTQVNGLIYFSNVLAIKVQLAKWLYKV